MKSRPPTGCSIFLFLLLLAAASPAVNLRNRSISSSGQFVIYCDNRDVRARVVGFVEDVKTEVLGLLREGDDWKFPIVVSLEHVPAQPPAQTVTISLVSTVAGPKVDVAVRIGDDPAKVFLQRHIIHALLLELAYRHQPPIRGGRPYAEPPWWLAEGILHSIRTRGGNGDPNVFKSIVNAEKLPPLEKFLNQPPIDLDSAAGAVDRALSMALVEALLHLPNGPQNLGRFLRGWPDSGGDAHASLAKHFPALAESEQSLSKWWTLHLAALAKSDQWRSLSPAIVDEELRAALNLDIPIDGKGRTQRFALEDFERFIKLPATRSALRTAQLKIASLSAKADALFRPILAEYEEICHLLAAGRTKGIAERLGDMRRYRKTVLRRAEQITDYLNWYEATQTPGATGQFDKYLRTVEAFAPRRQTPEAPDPRIFSYLDSLEQDFAPLLPNMIPGPAPTAGAYR